ncbi:BTAD domain-containing putative transcriptional regulator [Actinomadura sp. 9N407]|uniref:BTAD domain-containing putative transcriptional regulator n=1 Tax=Actinomadura sp. 9N407 TaxID=3375154 RepID=UPI0037BCAA5A
MTMDSTRLGVREARPPGGLSTAPHTAIDVLGPLRVRRGGEAVPLPKRRRSLLGLLALRPGKVVTVDRLVEGLWGQDAPPTAVRTLHSHIAKLGAPLTGSQAERLIQRREPGYLLAADHVHVDLARFEEFAAEGRRHAEQGRFAQAARAYRAGLALWRADALADCTVYGWAAAEVAYLEERRLDAQEGMYAALVAAGTPDGAVGELERLVALHPLRERFWSLLMVALQAGGRTGEALEAYQRARRTLVDALGTEPGEGLRNAEAAILRGEGNGRTAPTTAPGTAPRTVPAVEPPALPQPLNALIGRDRDIASVAERLGSARLVTLTGLGGSGKTRLAVEVAKAVAGDFGEVAFVDLAVLRDGGLVTAAVAEALGVRERSAEPIIDGLIQRVAHDRILIVLDNCEHLVGACARLAHRLLTSGRHLTILATSQEVLRVPGEVPWAVPPLGVPDPGTVRTAEDLTGHDAVTLFAERARIEAVERLSPQDARAVATICARCEGLPLAIELAAGRAGLLSLPETARYMRDRFAVLADGPLSVRPQHRALLTTVAWSYGLLAEEERGALRRVSVFPGRFTRQAAEAVWPGLPMLSVLGRLADKSLLKVVPTAAGMRYRLPETIREYAVARLADDPDEFRQAGRDHARHFLKRAEEIEPRLQGPELGSLMERLPDHHDDLRAAMAWLTAAEPEAALRLASALWRYHYLRGRYSEGRDWLRQALAAYGPGISPAVYAKACWAAAKLAALECDYQEAIGLAECALEESQKTGDAEGVARSKSLLASVTRELGDYGRSIELCREALAFAEAADDRWAAGHALQLLGFASWLSGDFAATVRWSGRARELLVQVGDKERLAWCRLDLGAAAYYTGDQAGASDRLEQALAEFRELRFKEGIAWAENLLALVDLDRRRPRDALGRLAVSLRLHTELGDRWRQASVLEALARCVAMIGDLPLAAESLRAARTVRTAIGAPVPPAERPALEATRARMPALSNAGPGPCGLSDPYDPFEPSDPLDSSDPPHAPDIDGLLHRLPDLC